MNGATVATTPPEQPMCQTPKLNASSTVGVGARVICHVADLSASIFSMYAAPFHGVMAELKSQKFMLRHSSFGNVYHPLIGTTKCVRELLSIPDISQDATKTDTYTIVPRCLHLLRCFQGQRHGHSHNPLRSGSGAHTSRMWSSKRNPVFRVARIVTTILNKRNRSPFPSTAGATCCCGK